MKRITNLRATKLNENDRKILDKYTGFHTNFIESNTAETHFPENEKRKQQE